MYLQCISKCFDFVPIEQRNLVSYICFFYALTDINELINNETQNLFTQFVLHLYILRLSFFSISRVFNIVYRLPHRVMVAHLTNEWNLVQHLILSLWMRRKSVLLDWYTIKKTFTHGWNAFNKVYKLSAAYKSHFLLFCSLLFVVRISIQWRVSVAPASLITYRAHHKRILWMTN